MLLLYVTNRNFPRKIMSKESKKYEYILITVIYRILTLSVIKPSKLYLISIQYAKILFPFMTEKPEI